MDDVKKKINKLIQNKKLKSILKIIIIISFIMLSILIAKRHEHWSDEAQSFLLARDTSIKEMFKYMKYEGTPPLWVLIIKIFITLGGTYQTFYILPIIFSAIGLIIFEYKVKAPWYIKLIFPFTYFIFYQYTIVARSYCLIFPLLMLLTVIYNQRYKKNIQFVTILFLFMNISLHTLMISGSIFLIYIIESIINNKIKQKKVIITSIIIFIELLITAILTYPSKDCSFGIGSGSNIFHIISEATIGSNLNIYLEIFLGTIILLTLILTLKKENIINFLILILPVFFVLIFITFQVWHVGIVWLLIFTYLIINNQINKNKIIKTLVLLTCFVQTLWTISSINYDYNNQYSGSKELANYLKKYLEEDKIIYGLGYSKTAIELYFEKNIFQNKLTDKSFHIWVQGSQEKTYPELFDTEVDLFIISDLYKKDYNFLIDFLEINNYQKETFQGYTYIKNDIYESESYIVYTKEPT